MSQSKPMIYFEVFLYYIYLAIHFLISGAQKLYLKYKKEDQIPEGKIRVHSIVFRKKLDGEEISKPEDFILSTGFLENGDVLKSPHWIPYCIDNKSVFYVLLTQPINQLDTKSTSFIFIPMFEKAIAVAEIPIQNFKNMFGALENAPKTVLFTNTARCGSTLLARMLTNGGHSTCFAEPHILCNLAIKHQDGSMKDEDIRSILPAIFNSFRIHVPSDQVAILKTTSGEARLVPLCDEVTNLKHIFMFRKNGFPSVEKMVRREGNLIEVCLRLFNDFNPMSISTLIEQERFFAKELKPTTLRTWAAIVYASPYSHYLTNKHFYTGDVVWFDEIIKDTENRLSSLFKEIGIPSEAVQGAAKCKDVDSQAGTFLSSSLLTHIKIEPLSNDDVTEFKHYSKVMSIPEDILVPAAE